MFVECKLVGKIDVDLLLFREVVRGSFTRLLDCVSIFCASASSCLVELCTMTIKATASAAMTTPVMTAFVLIQ